MELYHWYMDAYREGATGATVLQKTKEMKKSHRVPLVLDQLSTGGYNRSRGRRLLSETAENESEAGEGGEVVFDAESFAEKINQLGYPNNPRRRFARMGQLVRNQTKEAPRMADDFFDGLCGRLYFESKVEEHRWEKAMADEWGGATFVTTNDDEEWRTMWSSHREQMNNEDASQDNENGSED